MKDINKYGRNNKTCISSLDICHLFDYTDPEYFYLCNDMLNLSHVMSGDIIRFNLLDDDNEMYKIFGFVIMACNMGKTTFLVCRHYDENGKEYIQDYKYSSFKHAFKKLNDRHDMFIGWKRLTNIKDVTTPQEIIDLWLEVNHLNSIVKTTFPENSVANNINIESDYFKLNNCCGYTRKENKTPTLEELIAKIKQIDDRLRALEIEHGR